MLLRGRVHVVGGEDELEQQLLVDLNKTNTTAETARAETKASAAGWQHVAEEGEERTEKEDAVKGKGCGWLSGTHVHEVGVPLRHNLRLNSGHGQRRQTKKE